MTSAKQMHVLFGAILATLLAGCASLPPPSFPGAGSGSAASAAAPSTQAAEAAARRGDHAQAAQLYESLARSAARADAPGYSLLAASEWLSGGRAGEATRLVGALAAPGTALTPDQATWRRILDADLTLFAGQAQQAWVKIAAIAEPAAGAIATRYLDARMRIAMAAARPLDSVRAEVSAERLLTDNALRNDWRNRLLGLLRQARERGVKLDPATSADAVVKGWLDLGASLGAVRGASLTGGNEVARWRARNPGHPAADLVAAALPAPIALTGGTVTRIALLLPIGSTAEARVIRDGFQFALAQLPAAGRPELATYDTSASSASEQLATARAEGASFVVGPLLRNDVAAMAAAGTQAVPMLALNALPGDARGPDNFFQFALSPEDEARATARRVLADGLRRGVALSPSGEWGARVSTAFNQEFVAGGGTLLAQSAYDPNAADYSTAIKQILGVSESEARMRRLQQATGAKFEFEPRRRGDIQFIFAAASQPTMARLLRPQLGYQYAGDIPTYMTSAAYTTGAKEANEDLDGATIPGMPWLLPDASLDGVRGAAQQAGGNWQSQYFAFGYDACQLALAIATSGRDIARVRVAGLTGQLTLDNNGRVQRAQLWARIRAGEAQLLPDTAGN